MRENDNIAIAKKLRRRMTKEETRLWYLLRGRRFAGIKFRRQHAVGPYVCDFICLDHGLIIELDGGQHGTQQEADARRTAYFAKQGFTVLRFWNNELRENEEGVLQRIAQAASPNPLPQAGEGTSRAEASLSAKAEFGAGVNPSPVYGRGVRLSERSELSRSGEGTSAVREETRVERVMEAQ